MVYVRQETRRVVEGTTYRLVQNPSHAVHEELEVMRPMQSPKIMAIVILWRGAATILRNWIQNKYEEKLQAINNQNLLRISPDDVVIWNSP